VDEGGGQEQGKRERKEGRGSEEDVGKKEKKGLNRRPGNSASLA